MNISLNQQVALVTGASSGIGAAAATALAAAGASVVLNYHRQAAPAGKTRRRHQRLRWPGHCGGRRHFPGR